MSEAVQSTQCPHCGGATQGLVCEFCGSLLNPVQDFATEKRALEDFHGLLANATPEVQAKLLRHGFLPSQPQVLIDAGFRCLVLLKADNSYGETGHAARGRLKVIASKLHLSEDSEDARRAAKEFEDAVRDYENDDAANTRNALLFCAIALSVIGTMVWYVFKLFSR